MGSRIPVGYGLICMVHLLPLTDRCANSATSSYQTRSETLFRATQAARCHAEVTGHGKCIVGRRHATKLDQGPGGFSRAFRLWRQRVTAILDLDAVLCQDYEGETEFRGVRSQTEFGNERLEVTVSIIAQSPVEFPDPQPLTPDSSSMFRIPAPSASSFAPGSLFLAMSSRRPLL